MICLLRSSAHKTFGLEVGEDVAETAVVIGASSGIGAASAVDQASR